MNYKIYILICLMFTLNAIMGQISYPEKFETDKKKENLAGRLPLYSPTRCRPNELLYPGDQADDWICDCAPATIYHPESDACFPAFRQGPCPPEQILVLGLDKNIPECISNTCKIDGQVPINGVCYEFGKSAPCRNAHLSFVLGVDPATFQIDCVRLSLAVGTRLGDADKVEIQNFDFTTMDKCGRGTKRHMNRICPKSIIN